MTYMEQEINSAQADNAVEFSLDFQYAEAAEPALQKAEGKISKGSCVVLCGKSGCGKSTLLRCFNHLIPQFYEGELKGFCRLCGKELTDCSIGEAGRLAASVFQDPRSQFFTLNSSTELAFGLENYGFSHEEMVKRVDEAFEQFHLQRLKNRNVFALSSGERQLTAILSAWAMDTDIFLLDEPTANLDYAAVEQLSDLLLQMKKAGKTLLISEHRLYYLNRLADEYWLIQNGEICHKFTAEEFAALSPEKRVSFGLRVGDTGSLTAGGREESLPKSTELRADNLHFHYRGRKTEVIRGLSFAVHSGEVLGLVGRNGCGKTTLGKLSAGLYKPEKGGFYRDGRPVRRKELSDSSIFIMQEAEFQFFTSSVENELIYGRKLTPELKEEMRRLLKLTGLWECRHQHPFTLSGGQMQKLVLLLACLSEKPIVILDEPTAGLDYESLVHCAELIREMQKRKLVLIISHDPELLSMVCTRCIRIEEGQAAAEYRLTEPGEWKRLQECMKELKEKGEEMPKKKDVSGSPPLLDPRLKLLILAAAMIVGVWTDFPLIAGTLTAIGIAALYERRYSLVLTGVLCMGGLVGLEQFFPGTATAFMLYFFSRILLAVMAALLLLMGEGASRTLAGLRKLHLPEHAIMVCAVIFRFFPVLSADLGIMKQSVKTRGFFSGFSDKLRSAADYLEIMVVPMVFRVIRIGEALSASAETRGISVKGKRSSYLAVRFRAADWGMLLILAVCMTAGLLL